MPELPTMRPPSRHLARGFTLIELMITVAIVAILAAVALPSYRDYVTRGYLVDATTLLAAGQANMERYYQDNRAYPVSGSTTAPCAGTQGKFAMTCVTTTAPLGYTLTATGSTPVANFVYTIDNTTAKTTTITSVPGWTTTGTQPCWIVKKGMTC